MNLYLLAAAAGEAAPENKFGFVEAMKEGGPVAWSILAIMIIMSVGSFYIMFTKMFEQNKVMKQYKNVQTQFWRTSSLKEGATKLDKDSPWRQLADDAVKAQEDHGKMTDRLSGGLSFLATVGATAPFVGLLGTVIGIYRALINIGIAGNASIDKVAGPVGEALIMTAIGLLVAVPAVFAFNWLQSRNRKIGAMLSTFSTDLLAYMNSNGAVKPAVQGAAPAAKPAAKPAASPTTITKS
jgi:biopolymer transport protein ExbB